MNYSIHPKIREALKHAESVNVRGEVSIPLYRLKEELEKRRIERQDFKDYLFRYIPQSDKTYIEENASLAAESEADTIYNAMTPDELRRAIDRNRKLMKEAAKKLDFLQAEEYKQEVIRLEELLGK